MFDPNYEVVIGIEVHVELATKTKIFCSCSTEFGGEPNTHCCPVCTGMPGALPVLNGKVVDYAIKAGLATNCNITRYGKQDRKNYFYPDSPKAYQISQFDLPLCEAGYVDIEIDGQEKRIGITKIHIEEDAGKLQHEGMDGSLVDYNRCGVPLIEIVSEPDMRSPEEAISYLEKLRSIILYTGVSDCKMNEGSFRCDVNLSVRPKGQKEFGTRTEMKNLNSFNFALKAMEYEIKRQIKLIRDGEEVIQETRRWDVAKGKTISMRSKEDAHDYRYFPDPDLMPISVSDEKIETIKSSLPELPDSRKQKYMTQYKLSSYDAEQLTKSRYIADYFEEAVKTSKNAKLLANWIMGEVFRTLSDQENEDSLIPFEAKYLAELINIIELGEVNSSTAKIIFKEMWETRESPSAIVEEKGLKQINDDDMLITMAKEVIANNEKSVNDYLNGKEQAIKSLVGQMMKATKGKANPQKVIEILKTILDNEK